MENEKVYQYIMEFAPRILEQCELFINVYGKNFARRKLLSNLDKVYTNEVNQYLSGYMNFKKSTITICTEDKNIPIVTPSDIRKSKRIQKTIIHEVIHVILRKSKIECSTKGIDDGTGIMEMYPNGTELGRGLNEGFTEWLCKQVNFESNSYITFRTYIEILELAIGKRNVLELGKGNINERVSLILGMTTSQCKTFLKKIDVVLSIEERKTIISKTEDFKNEINVLNDQEDELKQNIGEMLYAKYFEKDFKQALKCEIITLQTMRKFQMLEDLLDECTPNGIERFKKIFDEMKKIYFEILTDKLIDEKSKGQLTNQMLEKIIRFGDLSEKSINLEFITNIAKILFPSETDKAKVLFAYLDISGQILDLDRYEIVKLKSGKSEIQVIKKDNETVAVTRKDKFKLEDGTEIPNISRGFSPCTDFAVEKGENKRAIIGKVLDFEDDILWRYPKAQIYTIDRLIVVYKGKKEIYYTIENGRIKRLREKEKIKLQIVCKKQNTASKEYIDHLKQEASSEERIIYRKSEKQASSKQFLEKDK